jgi:hypothetical protein
MYARATPDVRPSYAPRIGRVWTGYGEWIALERGMDGLEMGKEFGAFRFWCRYVKSRVGAPALRVLRQRTSNIIRWLFQRMINGVIALMKPL